MDLLQTIYLRIPAPLRRLCSPAIDFYRLFRCLRVDLWRVSGLERHSQVPLAALFAIPSEEKSYLTNLMFGPGFQELYLGRIWSWNISKAARKNGLSESMVLLKVEKPQFKLKARRGWFVIPNWVSAELSLPLDPKVLHSHAVKSDLKRIRENSLETEITRDPSQFEKFYREMHVPYMKNVHGGSAHIEPYRSLKNELPNCELFLVKKDGECISGELIAFPANRVRLWLLGVRDGDRGYLKMGAIAALYYLALDYLQQRGYKTVDLGWSRPFLKDGALRYKRKVGTRITGSHAKAVALKVVSFDAATRSFLENNPFIIEDEHGLAGAVFVDENTPMTETERQRLEKDYLQPGLARIVVHSMPNAEPSVRQVDPQPVPTQCE